MPEPLESELAGAALESAALPQEDPDYAAGDLRRPQQAPGQPHLDQAALQQCQHMACFRYQARSLYLLMRLRQTAVRLRSLPRQVTPKPRLR
jgi:hypothetical protein